MKIDGECLIELIGSCRNKVQVSRSVRMPQLRTLLPPSTFFLLKATFHFFLLKAIFHFFFVEGDLPLFFVEGHLPLDTYRNDKRLVSP